MDIINFLERGKLKEELYKSFDGTELNCYLWDDVQDPIGIVQISHGMAEHALRYAPFAEFLNKNGYIVFADDHRAHGKTSANASEKKVHGFHPGNIFEDTAEDLVSISNMLVERFKLPLVLVGHSYGSFLGQRYLQKKNPSKGVILTGTACNDHILIKLGRSIATSQYKKTGNGEESAYKLDKLSFGAYDKPFKKEGIKYAWLSRNHEEVKKYADDELSGQVMSVAFYRYMLEGLCNLYKPERLKAVPKDAKIAMFSGSDDPVGGKGKLVLKLEKMYKGLGISNVYRKLYPKARHEVLNEINRDEVFNDILNKVNEFIK